MRKKNKCVCLIAICLPLFLSGCCAKRKATSLSEASEIHGELDASHYSDVWNLLHSSLRNITATNFYKVNFSETGRDSAGQPLVANIEGVILTNILEQAERRETRANDSVRTNKKTNVKASREEETNVNDIPWWLNFSNIFNIVIVFACICGALWIKNLLK
jgi:hypothetical protein